MRGSIKMWLLAFVLLAGGGFAVLLGAGCAIGANVCPFSNEQPFTTTNGAEIYSARCAQCHGARGEGGRGPSLTTGDVASLSLPELVRKIEKGRPFYGMPAFKFGSRKLSAAQIEAVARYVTQLQGGTP